MITCCRETGEKIQDGFCPIHKGDACLIVLPDYVDKLERENERLFKSMMIYKELLLGKKE